MKNENVYRIYGRDKEYHIELLEVVNNKEKAINKARKLNPAIYDSYLIIEHNLEQNSDFCIDAGYFRRDDGKCVPVDKVGKPVPKDKIIDEGDER